MYCASKAELNRLQSVRNATAKVIFCWKKFDHVTPPLRNELHWLWIMEHIVFKRCLLVYKAAQNESPSNIRDLLSSLSMSQYLYTPRSDHDDNFDVLRTRTVFCSNSFTVSGPLLLNDRPPHIKDSLNSIKRALKTYLFPRSFNWRFTTILH